MNRYQILKSSCDWGICLYSEDGTCPVAKGQAVCNDCFKCNNYFSKYNSEPLKKTT